MFPRYSAGPVTTRLRCEQNRFRAHLVDQLEELLENGDVENLRLEFKSEVPDRDETLKKLSSFANTYGGTMVVGAMARSSDGRIESLPGVEPQQGYKQKVIDWCFKEASPPVTLEVSDPIPVANAKVCYLIRVAESDLSPHFLNGRKGIWVRVDEFSGRAKAELADETEIRHLLDRRKVIVERRTALLERARRRLINQTGFSMSPARLELCVVPRFPARPLCAEQDLQFLVSGSIVQRRGSGFPDFGDGYVSQHESVSLLRPMLDMAPGHSLFEVNIWGMLFYAMRIQTNEDGAVGIYLYRVVGSVSLFIRHAARMLQSMGYSGPVVLETSLLSIRGVLWHYELRGAPRVHSGAPLDSDVRFEVSTSAQALLEKPDGVAMDVLRMLMFSVNLPDQVHTPEKVEKLLRDGFIFNDWPPIQELKV
jgi:hypothetical protein